MSDDSANPISAIISFCAGLLSSDSKEDISATENEDTSPYPVRYTPEKQAKLNMLCENLFQQKSLIEKGHLQFLDMGQAKTKLGSDWHLLHEAVYKVVEETISKHTDKTDICIRYQDNAYAIILPVVTPEESEAKTSAIAEEIRTQMASHDEAQLRTTTVANGFNFMDQDTLMWDEELKDSLAPIRDTTIKERKKREAAKKSPSVDTSTQALDSIDSSSYEPPSATTAPRVWSDDPHDEGTSALNYTYMPIWDVEKNMIATYLCLGSKKDEEDTQDPFTAHNNIFADIPMSQETKNDILILKKCNEDISDMQKQGKKALILCPIRYETLLRSQGYELYIQELQKISDENKQYLMLMVIGMPDSIVEMNIKRFSEPLSNHCRTLLSMATLDSQTDFAILKRCKFAGIAMQLINAPGQEQQLFQKIKTLTGKIRRAKIKTIATLNTPSPDVASALARSGSYSMIGGPGIRPSADTPQDIVQFKLDDL